jgi:hypothetical protein
VHQAAGTPAVFFFAGSLAVVWVLVAATMGGRALERDGGRVPLRAHRSAER